MNFLILGDSSEERAWAEFIANSATHHVFALYPGFSEGDESQPVPARDLDDALATSGVEAVLIGGDPAFRAEALRRVAAEGLPAICLHPPGIDSEAYYLVTMSRAETGSVLVPDLAGRLHPGVVALREGMKTDFLGVFRGIKYEATVEPGQGDLVRVAFARAVDLVRSLVGEIEAVNASGEPAGTAPDVELVVQLRGSRSRRAEVRLAAGFGSPTLSRLSVTGSSGSVTLEFQLDRDAPARLITVMADRPETVRTFDVWSHKAALLDVLADAVSGRAVHPDLNDGTRAMEISEAVSRSLRRNRTVELHYEEISENGTFKSVMTSLGCLLLISILFVLPLALSGPALGLGGTIYLAYLIPPILVGFILLQLFRFATRGPAPLSESKDSLTD